MKTQESFNRSAPPQAAIDEGHLSLSLKTTSCTQFEEHPWLKLFEGEYEETDGDSSPRIWAAVVAKAGYPQGEVADLLVHWGSGIKQADSWDAPREADLPPFQPTLQPADPNATFRQTPFISVAKLSDARFAAQLSRLLDVDGTPAATSRVVVFITDDGAKGHPFVIHAPSQNSWLKAKQNSNFVVKLHRKLLIQSLSSEYYTAATAGGEVTAWSVSVDPTTQFVMEARTKSTVDFVFVEFLVGWSHPLLLHWGLMPLKADNAKWRRPAPQDVNAASKLPFYSSSYPVDAEALQNLLEFAEPKKAIQRVGLQIPSSLDLSTGIAFVFKEQHAQVWFNDASRKTNFSLPVKQLPEWAALREKWLEEQSQRLAKEKAEAERNAQMWGQESKKFLEEHDATNTENLIAHQIWKLEKDVGYLDVTAEAGVDESGHHIVTTVWTLCCRVPLTMHWGTVELKQAAGKIHSRKRGGQWKCPPKEIWPENTVVVDPQLAVQTPFSPSTDGQKFMQTVTIKIPAEERPLEHDADAGLEPLVGGLVAVLKETAGQEWYKSDNGRDIAVALSTAGGADKWIGSCQDVVDRIVEAEVEWDQMTLMHRYNLCTEIVEEWEKSGTTNVADSQEFWGWMFVWNRFSQLMILDWQRKYNTKPKDLSWACRCASLTMSRLWVAHPIHRPMIRRVLSSMSRGGGQGQAIRDRILDIMHKHHIPEHGANFYEQWHQKLHNNTTPDDIAICSSLIAYLESGGNLGVYWNMLNNQFHIDRDRLAKYERAVTNEPFMVQCDIGALIWDFKQYLTILKDVHESIDLHRLVGHISWALSGNVKSMIDAVLGDTNDQNNHFDCIRHKMDKICSLRCSILESAIRGDGSTPECQRDMLLFDFALETQGSIYIQNGNKNTVSKQNLTEILRALLQTLAIHNPTDNELQILNRDWQKLACPAAIRRYVSDEGTEDALLLKAMIDRLSMKVGGEVNELQDSLGPKSLYLGQLVEADRKKLNIFVDEVLRASNLFSVSVCLKFLEPLVRKDAELPPWQLISTLPEKVRGKLQIVEGLRNIQHVVFPEPTILLTGSVNGEEEIPTGVQAVLVRSAAESPDILSHVAVRARNARVLLAVAFDTDVSAKIGQDFNNSWVEVTITQGGTDLTVEAWEGMAASESAQSLTRAPSSDDDTVPPVQPDTLDYVRKVSRLYNRQATQDKLETQVPDPVATMIVRQSSLLKIAKQTMDLSSVSAEWVVDSANYTDSNVGAKSLNLQILSGKLPTQVTPRSVALPFGCMQKAIQEAGADEVQELHRLLAELATAAEKRPNEPLIANDILVKINQRIQNLKVPAELLQTLSMKLSGSDSLTVSGRPKMTDLYAQGGVEGATSAIRGVWASLFALRPWISLSKAHRTFNDLRMAVLVQEVLPAAYAFVLHSKNPFGKEKDEMYGEIVVGMGEALVSNCPGRAMSWRMKKGASPVLVSFPAKTEQIKAPGDGAAAGLIFRSDSNGEDQMGFAGAGLFESITALKSTREFLEYSTVRLVSDHQWRRSLLKQIGEVAFLIEDAFGDAMDIEGVVVADGTICIVQARPQV